MSYSQLGQDLEVIKTYNNKENGFFIEIGASDGIYFSNTYLLETKYKSNYDSINWGRKNTKKTKKGSNSER